MFNKQEIIKNISDHEAKIFLAKGLDRAFTAFKKQKMQFSDFSDPVKAVLLKNTAVKYIDVKAELFGGYDGAERALVCFLPEYGERIDPPVAYVLIKYNEKFASKPGHRDILGSVLGLGLDRGKIGDIVLTDSGAVAVVMKDVADFIAVNLEQAGHTRVSAEVIKSIEPYIKNDNIKETDKTVASMRLDAVVSCCFNISRGKACDYIKGGKVFINWAPCETAAKTVEEGSVITVRGLGRVKLINILGKTKRDKIIIRFVKF